MISLCAGQGRDVIEVLASHSRRAEVTARLVERDPEIAAVARQAVAAASLAPQVDVVTADAALTDAYRGMVPADVVLACGIFGNVIDADIRNTIDAFPQLCATGATVIWTRHRGAPDRVPMICEWFSSRGFELQWLSDPGAGFGVGVHRFASPPAAFVPGLRMFSFAPYEALR